jgi:hypothetical protein
MVPSDETSMTEAYESALTDLSPTVAIAKAIVNVMATSH